MRFPPKSYNKDLESAEDRREREAQDLELAKEMAEEDDDGYWLGKYILQFNKHANICSLIIMYFDIEYIRYNVTTSLNSNINAETFNQGEQMFLILIFKYKKKHFEGNLNLNWRSGNMTWCIHSICFVLKIIFNKLFKIRFVHIFKCQYLFSRMKNVQYIPRVIFRIHNMYHSPILPPC